MTAHEYSPQLCLSRFEQQGGKGSTITDEQLLGDLKAMGNELGRRPSISDLEKYGHYSYNAYTNHFGSWCDALIEAGYDAPTSHQEKIPNAELEADLRKVAEQVGKSPTVKEYSEHGKYSNGNFWNRYGSWRAAHEAAGVEWEYRGKAKISKLIESLIDVTIELGKPPTTEEMTEVAELSAPTYEYWFGSWAEALEMAGLPRRSRSGEISYGPIEPGEALYGAGWRVAREQALCRDRWRCQSCGMVNKEHAKEYGASLEVHHIVPIRKFDKPRDANFLDNLISLCRNCHNRWGMLTPDIDVDELVVERRGMAQ